MNRSVHSSTLSDFTEAHWDVLFSLLDPIIPPIVPDGVRREDLDCWTISEDEFQHLYRKLSHQGKNKPSAQALRDYLAARPSGNPHFVQRVKITVAGLDQATRYQLRGLLGSLATRLGSLVATGYLKAIHNQPIQTREAILQSWHRSWFFLWPMLARTFTIMARACWSQSEPLLQPLTNYQSAWENPDVVPGPSFNFDFLQFGDSSEAETIIDTDIVIVGSGCGGAVCAKVLAEAGHRVVVVDRGYHFPPSELPFSLDNMDHALQGGGRLATVDGSVLLVAGAAWGGGGTVNWNVCLQTPELLRKEWAAEGLSFFASSDYQESLERVSELMGVSAAHLKHNHGNQMLSHWSEELGWRWEVCPQNTGGQEHHCGCSCGLGCREGVKQGPAVSWLPAAAKSGARFIEGFEVSKILFDESPQPRKAIGIEGTWTSRTQDGRPRSTGVEARRRVQVQAKRVIIAGGSLNTPLLLLRSGLKNPHIGRNLHLHPCGCFTATFEEEVRGWEGETATAVVTEFDNLDQKGHGVKIMRTAMFPFITMLQLPWETGLQFKLDALSYAHHDCFISIARDRDTGIVTPDPVDDGLPIITYTPSKFDRKHIVAGLAATAKLCYLQGATKLSPIVPNVRPFQCSRPASQRTLKDNDFVEWLRKLESADMNPSSGGMFNSAHQMGSCRMGASEATGVVDGRGKVWGAEGLYVADASVFPSASGANPMLTIMAIADHIARGIDEGLKG
ncbi:long-chain fatty alcohol dehydrogenase [Xylariomycetidae sp. FL2044]|nr:long-chain fatty alcohol dehydrogenase [Xylariomycetidae sp. FL2044]